jgi:hypothetical protein
MTLEISKCVIFKKCQIYYVYTTVPPGEEAKLDLDDKVDKTRYHKRHILVSGNLKNVHPDYKWNHWETSDDKTLLVFPDDTINMSGTHYINDGNIPAKVLCIQAISDSVKIDDQIDNLEKSVDYELLKGNVYYIGVPFILNGKTICEKNTIIGCENLGGTITPMDNGQIVRFFVINSSKSVFKYDEETGMMV